ncbi:hypothetical protein ACHHYP_07661 [Achlya hypogyna]|uniref:Uncharacterized protein n=1 Tax=Achlya hypogyna TaxID=1202772 RepID=A0A1V9YQR2_ACHHY|nr:hypothetical protein ACHHYP_07661 [Achlya hypogyna]
MAYDPTLEAVASTRGRLNSVHALLEEKNMTTDEAGESFWTKLQAHVLEEPDAWLRAALLGRQALATCSPLCLSTAQVSFFNGQTDPSKQPSDMGIDRIYVSAAVFGALRQLLAVKPGLVQSQIAVQAFMVHLRQSINLLDERKQREEVFRILKDFLILHNHDAQAEATCMEFLQEDGAGIQATAVDGLLAIAARGHVLPVALVQIAWMLMLKAPAVDMRAAATRLFSTVALQHGAATADTLVHGLSLLASDRAVAVRCEAARAFRQAPAAWVPQLLTKTQLDEHAMEGKRWLLVCNGVLLSLLEDAAQEVRREASRTIAQLCAAAGTTQEALEHAVLAHADASHEECPVATQLQFLLSLDALLQSYARHRWTPQGRFPFSVDQLEYLLRHGLRASHAGGMATLLAVLAQAALDTVHHVRVAVVFLRDVAAPVYAAAPDYVQRRMTRHASSIGCQIDALLPVLGLPALPTSPLLAALTTPNLSPARLPVLHVKAVPGAPPATLAGLVEAPTSQAAAANLEQRVRKLQREIPKDFAGGRYYSLVLGVLDGLLAVRQGQPLPEHVADAAKTWIVVMPEKGAAVELLALLVSSRAEVLEGTVAQLAAAPELPVIQELQQFSTLEALQQAATERLRTWWPSTWLHAEPAIHRHVQASVDLALLHEPVTAVMGWPCDIPLSIVVRNVDDANNLVSVPHQETVAVELRPRDLTWVHASHWQSSLSAVFVPVAVSGLVHVEIVVCVRATNLPFVEPFLQPISPSLLVPVAISRPAAPRGPLVTAPYAPPIYGAP